MNGDKNQTIFTRNLNDYLKRRGVSQSEVATQIGIGLSTFSSWCTGARMPRMDKIDLLANYFGIQKSDLIEEKMVGTPYQPTRRIPILGRVSAGLPLYAEEQIEGYTYTGLNSCYEYFALRVQGDSMDALHIFHGDTLVVRRQEVVDNGEIAVVLVGDDDATVKRFYHHGHNVLLVPQSTNPRHQVQSYDLRTTPVRVLGKVVESKISFG